MTADADMFRQWIADGGPQQAQQQQSNAQLRADILGVRPPPQQNAHVVTPPPVRHPGPTPVQAPQAPPAQRTRFAPPQQQRQGAMPDPLAAQRQRVASMPDYVRVAPRAAQWVPQQRQTDVSPEQASELRDAQRSAFEQRAKADEQMARAQQAQAYTEELGATQQAQALEWQIRDDQADAKRKEETVARQIQALNDERSEIAREHVETGLGNGAAEFMAAIAVGLGAFGGALTGSPNYALEQINKTIDRKIREQERSKAARTDDVNARMNDYQRLLQQGETPEQAKLRLRGMMAAKAQAEMQAAAARDQRGVLRAKLEQTSAMLKAQQAESDAQYAQMAHGRLAEAYDPGRAGGVVLNAGKQRAMDALTKEEQRRQKLGHAYYADAEKAGVTSAERQIASAQEIFTEMTKAGMSEVIPTDENRNILARAGRGVVDFVGGDDTASQMFDSAQERHLGRLYTAWQNQMMNLANDNKVVSEGDAARLKAAVAGAKTPEDMMLVMQHMNNAMEAAKRGVQSAHTDEAVQYREGRKSALDQAAGATREQLPFMRTTD